MRRFLFLIFIFFSIFFLVSADFNITYADEHCPYGGGCVQCDLFCNIVQPHITCQSGHAVPEVCVDSTNCCWELRNESNQCQQYYPCVQIAPTITPIPIPTNTPAITLIPNPTSTPQPNYPEVCGVVTYPICTNPDPHNLCSSVCADEGYPLAPVGCYSDWCQNGGAGCDSHLAERFCVCDGGDTCDPNTNLDGCPIVQLYQSYCINNNDLNEIYGPIRDGAYLMCGLGFADECCLTADLCLGQGNFPPGECTLGIGSTCAGICNPGCAYWQCVADDEGTPTCICDNCGTYLLYCDANGFPTSAATDLEDNPHRLHTAIGCIPISGGDEFMGFILGWAIGIAGGTALLLIAFAGIQIMTAAGNPQRIQAGKELLTAAITGFLFVLFSVYLLEFIGINILRIPGL